MHDADAASLGLRAGGLFPNDQAPLSPDWQRWSCSRPRLRCDSGFLAAADLAFKCHVRIKDLEEGERIGLSKVVSHLSVPTIQYIRRALSSAEVEGIHSVN